MIKCGLKAKAKIVPTNEPGSNKASVIEGTITKIYDTGDFELRDSKGGLTFCLRREFLSLA